LEKNSTIEATREDGSRIFGDSSRTLLATSSGRPTRPDLLSHRNY